jgi:hypothetical protein
VFQGLSFYSPVYQGAWLTLTYISGVFLSVACVSGALLTFTCISLAFFHLLVFQGLSINRLYYRRIPNIHQCIMGFPLKNQWNRDSSAIHLYVRSLFDKSVNRDFPVFCLFIREFPFTHLKIRGFRAIHFLSGSLLLYAYNRGFSDIQLSVRSLLSFTASHSFPFVSLSYLCIYSSTYLARIHRKAILLINCLDWDCIQIEEMIAMKHFPSKGLFFPMCTHILQNYVILSILFIA